jgi:hypothetical protein
MDNKVYLITSLVAAVAIMITPVKESKYIKPKKDQIHIKAEKYLEDLKHENEVALEDLKHDVDSLTKKSYIRKKK